MPGVVWCGAWCGGNQERESLHLAIGSHKMRSCMQAGLIASCRCGSWDSSRSETLVGENGGSAWDGWMDPRLMLERGLIALD